MKKYKKRYGKNIEEKAWPEFFEEVRSSTPGAALKRK